VRGRQEVLDQRVLRDSHGTPLPGGASKWMLLDDVVDDGAFSVFMTFVVCCCCCGCC
jgi:hypothetical protein